MQKTLSALALVLATATAAQADSFQFGAAIDVLEALNVTEEKQMDFGVIERPTQVVLVDMNDDSTLGAGTTAKYIDTSTLAAGEYRVTGSNQATISISAADAGNVPGMSFQGLAGNYNAGESAADLMAAGMSGLSAPGAGGKLLIVGGQLEVQPSVEEGTYAPAFTMDVNYE